MCRNNRPKVLCKKVILKICKIHRKLPARHPATLLKSSLGQVFSCEFCKIFKNTFLYRRHPVAASVFVIVNQCVFFLISLGGDKI